MEEGCKVKADWLRCYTHSKKCTQCNTVEDCPATYVDRTGLCCKCIKENIREKKLVKDMSEFVCSVCGSSKTVRDGNKYACWEGDALNYRRRKNHTPHGETYS